MSIHIECCRGDVCTPAECLEHAASRQNKCNFTYELLASLFATVQERDYISTTTLIAKCLRREFLKRTEDYTVVPMDLYAAWRGTMFHGQLEQFFAPGAVAEARFHAELPDLGPLSGSPDLLDVQAGLLYDYKNTQSIPRFGKPWDDHVQQLNINRWLVDHAHTVETDRLPLLSTKDHLQWEECDGKYFFDLTNPNVREKFVPMDWQGLIIIYMDEKGPAPMLATKSVQVPKKGGGGTKPARVPDIWPDEQAEDFIRSHYVEAKTALVEGVLPEIPPGFEGQAHPLCGYCPKRARCRELELEQLLRAA